jgi:hypothetical protein
MVLVLATCAWVTPASGNSAGDIDVYIRDFAGNQIAPGPHVRAEVWGASQPKGGGGWTWHYLNQDGVDDGAGNTLADWSAADIDSAVDLDNNNFYFAVTAWGGSPFSNTQIDSLDGLWSSFVPYDPTLPAQTWEARVSPQTAYPGTDVPGGIEYDLDLQGLTPVSIWSSAMISYEGCPHDAQPVISATTRTFLESQGYVFDETLLDTNGLLRVTNPALGYDQTVSARRDGNDGYVAELEIIGSGNESYDPTADKLLVEYDFDAIGLSLGDTYYNRFNFVIEEDISADYRNGGYQMDSWFTSGYFGSVLAPQQVVPEPLTMLAVGSAVVGLGGYIRRRRRD